LADSAYIWANDILARCDELASLSESPTDLTRTFLTPEHARANELVAGWMVQAGMTPRMDAAGNVVGRYEGSVPGAPALMLASHLDTVRNAGKYDGMLGVVAAIACVDRLNRDGVRLTCPVEVIGFVNEEGTRFGATLTGSRAVAGTFNETDLDARDAAGVTMREAYIAFGLDPDKVASAAHPANEIAAYLELHIEQGPVLERENLAVGIVTAISGATRTRVELLGLAGHAGTVPMGQRRDALAGAAEIIAYVEKRCSGTPGLVGTVGWIEASPGAVNVVPGGCAFSLDIRAETDGVRSAAVENITAEIAQICARRGLSLTFVPLHDAPSSLCSENLMLALENACAREGFPTMRLPSGAGHDAMAVATIAEIGMLFIRCTKGISHNPAEAVLAEDVEAGARVLYSFIRNFGVTST
jgi:allantoate deiminase